MLETNLTVIDKGSVNLKFFAVKMLFIYRTVIWKFFPNVRRYTDLQRDKSSLFLITVAQENLLFSVTTDLVLPQLYISLLFHEPEVANVSVLANEKSHLASQRNF